MLPSFDQHLNPSSDVTFFKAIDLRGKISKLSPSVGSYKVSSGPFSLFEVDKTSFSKLEEVESTHKSVLNPEELEHVEAKVSSAQASRSRGVSKEFLLKILLVNEHLAESSIERNAQIRHQTKYNYLSRNCTTNDHMLRCKIL